MIDNQVSAISPNILLLGGTTEASQLARLLAGAGLPATFSYAGRTDAPMAQPLPTRTGGFGGVDGMVAYIRDHAITHVIDATHPFAAQMSANAIATCAQTGTALLALERPLWAPGPRDLWTHVAGIDDAVRALPQASARVFLAIGKQHLAPFAARPQHHYLLRLVDPPGELPLPDATAIIAKGPFTFEGDLGLLAQHRISHIVAKNSGGSGARAKLDAARSLGLPVILIDRPVLAHRRSVTSPEAAMDWLMAQTAR
jgi:precorrin-6A/cobalt-precorrin-6A reductase